MQHHSLHLYNWMVASGRSNTLADSRSSIPAPGQPFTHDPNAFLSSSAAQNAHQPLPRGSSRVELSGPRLIPFLLSVIFAYIFHRVLPVPLGRSCAEFWNSSPRVQISASVGRVQVVYSYVCHHNNRTTLMGFVLNKLVHEAYRKCSAKHYWLFAK